MTAHTLRVLLVEDDATSCMEINDYINQLDDVTLVASTNNASTAIEYMEKFLPDAVILTLNCIRAAVTDFFLSTASAA